jgi:undecaprenyl-diphosphatase
MSLASLLKIDADCSARMRIAEKPGALHTVAALFGHSGDSWFWLAGLALVWVLGSGFWKVQALVLGGGILVTAVLVMVLKFTIRRRRPEGEWGQIYRKTDPHSFPSGHAARAFLLAVLALGLGPAWFGWLLLIWAPLVGIARVALGVHYLSDIVVGWIIGILMGVIILSVIG